MARLRNMELTATDRITKKQCVIVLSVLGGALLLKLIYLYIYSRQMPFFRFPMGDSLIYLEWARNIAAGDLLSLAAPYRVFYHAPLYPYVLAPFAALFGANLLPVYLFQALLGTLNLFLIYRITRRLFSHWPGVAAVALAALYAPMVFMETKVVPTVLLLTLLLASVYILLADWDGGRRHWFAGGLMLGLATLTWGGAAVVLPTTAGFHLLRRRRRAIASVLLFAAGWVLPVLPAAVHNAVAGGDVVLVNSNSGLTFYQGNNPEAVGTLSSPPEVFEYRLGGRFLTTIYDQQQFDLEYPRAAVADSSLKPSQASAFWLRRGLGWIVHNPLRYARLELNKLLMLLGSDELGSNYSLPVERERVPLLRFTFVPFALILGLAVSTLLRRRGAGRLVVLLTLAFGAALVPLVFYVTTRYRLPFVLPLIVLAGAGIDQVVRQWHKRNLALVELGITAIVLVASLVLFVVPIRPLHRSASAFDYRNIAETFHLDDGDLENATAYYDRALEVLGEARGLAGPGPDPDMALTLMMSGDCHRDAGDARAALADYRAALNADPGLLDLAPRLARGFYDVARRLPPATPDRRALLTSSLVHSRRWLQGSDSSTDARLQFASTTLALGDTLRADSIFRAVLECDSTNTFALLSVGDILAAAGDSVAAIECFQQAAVSAPIALEPALRLGRWYAGSGGHGRARDVLRALLVHIDSLGVGQAELRRASWRDGYVELKLRLALAHLNLGEWDEAEAQAQQVLDLVPGQQTARQLLGCAREQRVPRFVSWQ